MNIFTREIINTGRQEEIDLVRGFTAILIVWVHVGLYLGNNISKGLWTFCDIIGSEFCAPVFMVLMGICLNYSRHQTSIDLLKRGISLFILGYVLNFFRSLLPLLILGNINEWATVGGFFVVDILPFAGLSFMLFSLFKKLNLTSNIIFVISLIMVYVNQFIMLPTSVPWKSEIITGLVNLFCPTSEWSCFPLLTWFAFPAFGLLYGELLKRCNNKNKLYSILLPIGLIGVCYVYYQFYKLYPDYTNYYWGKNFYFLGLKNVLLNFLFACFALSFWFFLGKILNDKIKGFLCYLSKNIITYYILSWILISILIQMQSINKWVFDTSITVVIMLLLPLICAALLKPWLSIKAKFQKKKFIKNNSQK